MANITDATLTYDGAIYPGVTKLLIDFTIHWSAYERDPELGFDLQTELWGKDVSRDDHLYTGIEGRTRNGEPSQDVHHSILIGTDRLNEDWGRDEIYAKIKVSPIVEFLTAEATTNEVHRKF